MAETVLPVDNIPTNTWETPEWWNNNVNNATIAPDIKNQIQSAAAEALHTAKTLGKKAWKVILKWGLALLFVLSAKETHAQRLDLGVWQKNWEVTLEWKITGLSNDRNPYVWLTQWFYKTQDSLVQKQTYFWKTGVEFGMSNTAISHTTNIGNVAFVPSIWVYVNADCQQLFQGDLKWLDYWAIINGEGSLRFGNTDWSAVAAAWLQISQNESKTSIEWKPTFRIWLRKEF